MYLKERILACHDAFMLGIHLSDGSPFARCWDHLDFRSSICVMEQKRYTVQIEI